MRSTLISNLKVRQARDISRRRGSTLIELLVVIGIIGILVTMLIPSLRRSLNVAKSVACQQHLHSIFNAIAAYRSENDGWLPVSDEALVPSALASSDGADSGRKKAWFLKLYPKYLNQTEALSCPRDPYGYRMEQFAKNLDDPNADEYSSYGINSIITTTGGGALANLDRQRPTRPGDIMLAADLGPDEPVRSNAAPVLAGGSADSTGSGKQKTGFGSRNKSFTFNGPRRNGSLLSWDDGYDPLSDEVSGPWITMRHGDGINVLTLTGGVRKARTKGLIGEKIRPYYIRDRAGGCALCAMYAENHVYHYAFWRDRLFWWTGPIILKNDGG